MILISRYFRIKQNQGNRDEGELSEIVFEENQINHE